MEGLYSDPVPSDDGVLVLSPNGESPEKFSHRLDVCMTLLEKGLVGDWSDPEISEEKCTPMAIPTSTGILNMKFDVEIISQHRINSFYIGAIEVGVKDLIRVMKKPRVSHNVDGSITFNQRTILALEKGNLNGFYRIDSDVRLLRVILGDSHEYVQIVEISAKPGEVNAEELKIPRNILQRMHSVDDEKIPWLTETERCLVCKTPRKYMVKDTSENYWCGECLWKFRTTNFIIQPEWDGENTISAGWIPEKYFAEETGSYRWTEKDFVENLLEVYRNPEHEKYPETSFTRLVKNMYKYQYVFNPYMLFVLEVQEPIRLVKFV